MSVGHEDLAPRFQRWRSPAHLAARCAREQQMGARWAGRFYPAFEHLLNRVSRNLESQTMLFLDLRLPQGSDIWSLDTDRVVRQARVFPIGIASFVPIVNFLDGLGFPKSYGESQFAVMQQQVKRNDFILIAVGDVVASAETVDDFCHSLAAVTTGELMRMRTNMVAHQIGGEAAVATKNAVDEDDASILWRTKHQCGLCGKACKELKCGRCGQVYYCDKACQRSHWKRHKPECAQRQRAVDNLSTVMEGRSMTSAEKRVGQLTTAGMDAMLSEEQAFTFKRDVAKFRESMIDSDILPEYVRKLRTRKFVPGKGDDAETTRRKGEAGTREIWVMIDKCEYIEFVGRYLQSGDERSSNGEKKLLSLQMIGGDITEIAALAEQSDELKRHFKMMTRLFKTINPSQQFFVTFTDKTLGPFADLTFPVDYYTVGWERCWQVEPSGSA